MPYLALCLQLDLHSAPMTSLQLMWQNNPVPHYTSVLEKIVQLIKPQVAGNS